MLDSCAASRHCHGVLPANTLVEQPLSVDLNHADEGHGLVYAEKRTSGMTIDSNTGVWLNTSTRNWCRRFAHTETHRRAGNYIWPIGINVMEQPKVRISLKAVDRLALITTVATGQQFKVQVIVV
ncbi:MAG: hypothetical protein R3C56_04285 [Pirellulaceae bacterium]